MGEPLTSSARRARRRAAWWTRAAYL